MKISQLLKEKPVTLSLEVFPPKTSEKYEATAALSLIHISEPTRPY